MDSIREAFQKVKKEISLLFYEISSLKNEIASLKEQLSKQNKEKNNLETQSSKGEVLSKQPSMSPAYSIQNKTIQHTNPTNQQTFNPLKDENLDFSTGNKGVPTDRQTDQQTDITIQEQVQNKQIKDIDTILSSLDSLKKEVRLKFKRLTNQEFLIFSQIYQLEEETSFVDYKKLSNALGLTESSIRDYVGKLIKKGVPVEKKRVNNKVIHLSVPAQFKKIVTLPTILKLREI